MTGTPTFPPLMSGEAAPQGVTAMEHAQARAAVGCDAGLVTYRIGDNLLEAAIVFAPEIPLHEAMAMLPVCGIGFQNALGALAPPEVAVHLEWQGSVRVNGARCGRLDVAASTTDPEAVPDWLVIGLTLPLWPTSDNPGETPDETALYAEGCADVEPLRLLEGWARHTLVWINRWSEGDHAAIHAEWRGLAQDMGEEVTVMGRQGTFMGIDEHFGMLLRQQAASKRLDQAPSKALGPDTIVLPLTLLLEQP